jgi:hypothetical protein
MHVKKIILLLLVFKYTYSCSQPTYVFRGKVLHNKTGAMKQFSILVDDKPATTNDAGVFEIGLNNNTTHVRISLNQTSYDVLYPAGGYLPIPRNLDDIPQIIIGNPKENIYLATYTALYGQIKKNNNTTATDLLLLTKRLDSMGKVLLSLHYTETDLSNAQELEDGKEKWYPEITASLVTFQNTCFDLKNAMKYIAEYAFEKNAALQQLYEAEKNYNASRDLLDRQHYNYEKYIANYWQDETLKKDLHQLISYALDTVHTMQILPLQKVVTQINQYQQEGKKNNDLKKTILGNINQAMPGIEDAWKKLEQQTKTFLTSFSN